ncbi:hypothetical protein ACU4HD_45560 (plasmid) [Cupriavidus basilensis]
MKHEDVYLKGYANMAELMIGLAQYFSFYNEERPHQIAGLQNAGGHLCQRRGRWGNDCR